MAKKKASKVPKWVWFAIPPLLLLARVSYSIISPYQNWTSYTIDNFITFRYPAKWHMQQENFKELSGTEDLFLLSNYNGPLSTQSLSSPEVEYLIEAYGVSKDRVKTMDEYSSFINGRCDNNICDTRTLKLQKNGFNVLEVFLTNERGKGRFGFSPFYGGESYMFVEADKYIYMIHIGFIPGPGSFTDFFRQRLIDKIFSTIQIHAK